MYEKGIWYGKENVYSNRYIDGTRGHKGNREEGGGAHPSLRFLECIIQIFIFLDCRIHQLKYICKISGQEEDLGVTGKSVSM